MTKERFRRQASWNKRSKKSVVVGEVETLDEYLARGGQITVCPSYEMKTLINRDNQNG